MTTGGRIVVAALLLAALSACAPAPTRQDRIAARPTLLSMNPCIDAILFQVADADQIVAVSHYSQDPRSSSVDVARARRYRAIHDTAEEAIALQPDIVLLGPHVAAATQAAIRASGSTVVSIGVPATLGEGIAQVRQVGAVAGYPNRGEALARRIEAALASSAPPADQPAVPAIIRQGDGLVPGQGTLADELMVMAGFRNMASAFGLAQWDILPLERLALTPPRVVLTDLRKGGGPLRFSAATGSMTADFPAQLLQCAGPNLIEAAGRLKAIRQRVAGA